MVRRPEKQTIKLLRLLERQFMARAETVDCYGIYYGDIGIGPSKDTAQQRYVTHGTSFCGSSPTLTEPPGIHRRSVSNAASSGPQSGIFNTATLVSSLPATCLYGDQAA
jgi:hypothetical protein